jgi:TRAP-type mannitol/chloroaromatic compound transport system permease small subunit
LSWLRAHFHLLSFGVIGCWVLAALTFEQVIARYLWDQSSIFIQELQLLAFSMTFLLALGPALSFGQHVCVDVFSTRFSKRTKQWVEVVGFLLFLLPTSCMLVFYGWQFAMNSRSFAAPEILSLSSSIETNGNLFFGFMRWLLAGERSPNAGGIHGFWLIKLLIPVSGLGLLWAGLQRLGQNILQGDAVGGEPSQS